MCDVFGCVSDIFGGIIATSDSVAGAAAAAAGAAATSSSAQWQLSGNIDRAQLQRAGESQPVVT